MIVQGMLHDSVWTCHLGSSLALTSAPTCLASPQLQGLAADARERGSAAGARCVRARAMQTWIAGQLLLPVAPAAPSVHTPALPPIFHRHCDVSAGILTPWPTRQQQRQQRRHRIASSPPPPLSPRRRTRAPWRQRWRRRPSLWAALGAPSFCSCPGSRGSRSGGRGRRRRRQPPTPSGGAAAAAVAAAVAQREMRRQ